MDLCSKLNLVEIVFDDIRQGDVVGYKEGVTFTLGVASFIITDGSTLVWYTEDNDYLCSEYDSGIYGQAKEEKVEMIESNPRPRRGRFPDGGTLVLIEDVGEWEKGLTFIAGADSWYLLDEDTYAGTPTSVSKNLLVELFEEGKLLVTERF